MKRTPVMVVGLMLGSLLAGPVAAISDQQYQAIRALGDLNGVALHCRYLDQTHRMKKALVRVLPKRRALGQGFDDVTNESFLRFIEEKASCPDLVVFSEQVGDAIHELELAFGKSAGIDSTVSD